MSTTKVPHREIFEFILVVVRIFRPGQRKRIVWIFITSGITLVSHHFWEPLLEAWLEKEYELSIAAVDVPGWILISIGLLLYFYNQRLKKTEPSPGKQESETDQDLQADIDAYCKSAQALYENLPLMGFRTKLRVPIRIEDIYVPLSAMLDMRATGQACFADAEDAEKELGRVGESKDIALAEAFSRAQAMERRGIVILGDPGSGKTTHMKRLLLWCLREGPDKLGLAEGMIPVFLPLRDLRDLDQGLDAFIQDQLDKPHLGTPAGFGQRLVKRGNLLFLLDGLDEVADPDQRARVARWIDTAVRVQRHRTCRFVVTCRFAGYTDQARLCEQFLEMHLRPLSFDQVKIFVGNWYRIVETGLSKDARQAAVIADEKSQNLIDRLGKREFRARRVFELTRNPLLLTNICLVHRDRGNLPHSRDRLYAECTDVLLELWRAAIGYQTRVVARSGRKVLQPAALWMHQKEGRTRARAGELAPVIEPALKAAGWPHGSAEDFLSLVRDESGLLTGWGQEQYGFMHLGFQEYLAALEIQNNCLLDPKVLDDLAGRFGQSWWQEVTLLLLSLSNPCLFVPFMRALVRQSAFTQHPELVEMCLDDAAEKPVLPFVELLQTEAGNDPGHWQRQLAALKLVERLNNEALSELVEQLARHPYDKIRQRVSQRADRAAQEVVYAPRGGYELVRIRGGEFLMGSPGMQEGRYDREGPQHTVRVPDFYIGRYPVTNEEYGRFLAQNPDVNEPKYWADRQYNQPRQPVIGVTWKDARQYARWAGLELPSEAQWEYACRAGKQTRFHSGDKEKDLERAGWYRANSDDTLHPVGEKEPNSFGLYDMHGNVWEWIEDDWHKNYKGAPGDGSAWVDEPRGSYRVIRGGSWDLPAGDCRSAARYGGGPGDRHYFLGFRLVLLPGQPG
jgi:formylglycine-generating enzyme required for sulfatase activity